MWGLKVAASLDTLSSPRFHTFGIRKIEQTLPSTGNQLERWRTPKIVQLFVSGRMLE